MEIYNGLDKAGTGLRSQYPYPIEMRYDIEHRKVYLTPIRIPDYPVLGYPIPNSEDYPTLSDLNDAGKLELRIEVSTSLAFHGNGRPGCPQQPKHPCRSGKFYSPGGSDVYTDIVPGDEYEFNMSIPRNLENLLNSENLEDHIFFYLRGTNRMATSNPPPTCGIRTGIYSNTALIEIRPPSE